MLKASPLLRYVTVALAVIFGAVGGRELPLGPSADSVKVAIVTALMSGGLLWYLLFGSGRSTKGGVIIFFAGCALALWMVLAHYMLGMIIVKAFTSAGAALMVTSAINQAFPKLDASQRQSEDTESKADDDKK
jgi:hypothetical protein